VNLNVYNLSPLFLLSSQVIIFNSFNLSSNVIPLKLCAYRYIYNFIYSSEGPKQKTLIYKTMETLLFQYFKLLITILILKKIPSKCFLTTKIFETILFCFEMKGKFLRLYFKLMKKLIFLKNILLLKSILFIFFLFYFV
jgi:hypothetical protein